jgi:hypothetical protein
MSTSIVALAGNGFITASPAGGTIDYNNGLYNWSNSSTICSTYFRMASAGEAKVELNAYVPGSPDQESSITVTINDTPYTVQLSGATPAAYSVGNVTVTAPGYVKVDMQGVTKSSDFFGVVSGLSVTTTSTLNYASDPESYYWSRRGPSVHMNYAVPDFSEYFYNEVTVPVGQDVAGSYFMTAGFNGGYSGIQVRENDRWVIFSVWDSDSGEKATPVSNGANVTVRPFDGEGNGMQSFREFDWVAGNTYKFITRVRPDHLGNTLYSAWFFAPELDSWSYLATIQRPSTSAWQSGVYSFLENFSDTQGYLGRHVQYDNQWVRDVNGTWQEITQALFTGDSTARAEQRMDYAGGVEDGRFYLHNGAFFDDYVQLDQTFNRPATGRQPEVDVDTLPTE